jgi:hypothetical protein
MAFIGWFPLGGFEFEAHTFGISASENNAVRIANVIALANNDVSVCVNLCGVHGLAPIGLNEGEQGARSGRQGSDKP